MPGSSLNSACCCYDYYDAATAGYWMFPPKRRESQGSDTCRRHRDHRPECRRLAVRAGVGSTYALAESLCLYGLVPGDLLGHLDTGHAIPLGNNLVCRLDGPHPETVLTSMFMHGGWFHILGNMWFLWVFGDNIEDVMGPTRFVVFYVLCGAAAAFAQILTDPASGVPMVGASGAIGGVMGAYALLYPRAMCTPLSFSAFTSRPSRCPRYSCSDTGFCCRFSAGCPPSAQPGAASPSGRTLVASWLPDAGASFQAGGLPQGSPRPTAAPQIQTPLVLT